MITQLLTECAQAEALDNVTEVPTPKPLTCRERWRIPIVFIKTSHNRHLSVSDAKIWRAVRQNMKSDEDSARMVAVLTLTPHRQRCSGIWPPHSPSKSFTSQASLRKILTTQSSLLHLSSKLKTQLPRHHSESQLLLPSDLEAVREDSLTSKSEMSGNRPNSADSAAQHSEHGYYLEKSEGKMLFGGVGFPLSGAATPVVSRQNSWSRTLVEGALEDGLAELVDSKKPAALVLSIATSTSASTQCTASFSASSGKHKDVPTTPNTSNSTSSSFSSKSSGSGSTYKVKEATAGLPQRVRGARILTFFAGWVCAWHSHHKVYATEAAEE